MNTKELRQAFLDFYKSKDHTVVDSSSLLPVNDDTLLFTNAGMVQFKDVFLGTERKNFTRATTSQRCIRAGGKHNDLENVGYTLRHHTFFEMLGNFSFGDYFKEDAIKYAWEFLTEVLKLDKDKLWITVYKDDDEAEEIWKNIIGVDASRIARLGDEDNFWSMGDTGPCGPCSEIFYDHGDHIEGTPPGADGDEGDRFIEIWNLVFMQFNRDEAGAMEPLPKPSVDTGMGLERIAAVLQGVNSNYDTDVFKDLILASQKILGHEKSTSHKVIADHIRSAVFLIADGVVPEKEGRGYVLRRIMRRGIRHGYKMDAKEPFMHLLVKDLIKLMSSAYPELKPKEKEITQAIKNEEFKFFETLEKGIDILEDTISKMTDKTISGDVVDSNMCFFQGSDTGLDITNWNPSDYIDNSSSIDLNNFAVTSVDPVDISGDGYVDLLLWAKEGSDSSAGLPFYIISNTASNPFVQLSTEFIDLDPCLLYTSPSPRD